MRGIMVRPFGTFLYWHLTHYFTEDQNVTYMIWHYWVWKWTATTSSCSSLPSLGKMWFRLLKTLVFLVEENYIVKRQQDMLMRAFRKLTSRSSVFLECGGHWKFTWKISLEIQVHKTFTMTVVLVLRSWTTWLVLVCVASIVKD